MAKIIEINPTIKGTVVEWRLNQTIDIRNTIERAWWACDFAHKSIVIKPLSNTYGWLDYITKEANVGNVDALRIQSIKQPQIYLSDIGVENSL